MQWSLLFYTLENYEPELGDPELGPALIQLALATVAQQEVRIISTMSLSSLIIIDDQCDSGQQTSLHHPSYRPGEVGGRRHCQREGA